MSSEVVESTVQEVLEEVVTALGLKGEVEVDRDGDRAPQPRTSAPPRPPRQRRKKKTGRRR